MRNFRNRFFAHAQTVDFSHRPLRFVVGFPPGRPNELLTRIVAPGIGQRLGRTVVVEYRTGANGEIAAASVAINPMLLVVCADLLAMNVVELLALAGARPGKLNGASAGAGGATHLALELFKAMGKLDIVHVPYKDGGPAMADLMAGMVDLRFGGLSTALPHFKSGKLRALGQTGKKRSIAAPGIPTIDDAGLPGYEAAISYGIFLPAGASPVLVSKLHAAVDATVRSPEVAARFAELGADPQFGTPREFAAYVAADLDKWSTLAKSTGLKAQ